jgi:hypothetical protein
MGVRGRVGRASVESEHVCQFFDSDESRVDCVGEFLLRGHRTGDHLIVIARPQNWTAITDYLNRHDVPVTKEIEKGRITVCDAVDMLRRLSPNGPPNAGLFDAVIGALIDSVAEHGRVCAYGEMVDILAQRGDMGDMLKLEAFWNDLLARMPVTLMCGYSAAHFVSPATHATLRKVCNAHARIDQSMQDPLATWLLIAAQTASSALVH